MSNSGTFTVVTEVFGKRMWFAGAVDGSITMNIVLTPTIFDAWHFDSREEAEELIEEELGDQWSISEIIDFGVSDGLEEEFSYDEARHD